MIHRTVARPSRRTHSSPPLSALPEYYSLMRNLAGTPTSPVIRSICVTSSKSGEGVSTVALQCAIAAHQLFSQPVLLVEANAARPSLHRTLKLERGPGFGDLLLDAEPRESCVQALTENLLVATPGNADVRLLRQCSAHAIARTVSSLHEGHRLTVWDLPHVAPDNLSLELAAELDGVLLVVESEGVLTDVAQEAVAQLRASGAKLLGVVLNKHREHLPRWLASRL